MNEDLYDLAGGILFVSAKRVHARYKDFVDLGDVQQEGWIWVLKHGPKVREWLGEDSQDPRWGANKLGLSLRREMERFCRREKATITGYKPEDEFYYNTGIVDQVLTLIYQPSSGSRAPDESKGRKPSQPSEGGNLSAMLADVAAAVDTLDQPSKDLIVYKYFANWSNAKIARNLGIKDETAAIRLRSVLDRIVDELGGEKP